MRFYTELELIDEALKNGSSPEAAKLFVRLLSVCEGYTFPDIAQAFSMFTFSQGFNQGMKSAEEMTIFSPRSIPNVH